MIEIYLDMENGGHRAPFFSLFLFILCSYFINLVKANGALIFAVSKCWHTSTGDFFIVSADIHELNSPGTEEWKMRPPLTWPPLL